MASYFAAIPPARDFFPPTPQAFNLLFTCFKYFPLFCLLQWTPLSRFQAMSKTSMTSALNLPGRYIWSMAESIGPINMIFILSSLPWKIHPRPSHDSSWAGTGLPAQNEILGLLYVLHYLNRAIITPLFFAPSMSPIHAGVATFMAMFQCAYDCLCPIHSARSPVLVVIRM